MNDLWAPVVYQAVLMPVIFDSEYFKRILLLQFISANSCANFSESVHQRVIFRTFGMNICMPVIFCSEYLKKKIILLLQFIVAVFSANFSESVHWQVIFQDIRHEYF